MRQLISALKLERNDPIFAELRLLIGACLTYQGFVRSRRSRPPGANPLLFGQRFRFNRRGKF
jgi:hypothetical protein